MGGWKRRMGLVEGGGVISQLKTSQFRVEKRHILTKISQNTIYCLQLGIRIS